MIHEEIIIRPDGRKLKIRAFPHFRGFCFAVYEQKPNGKWEFTGTNAVTPEEIYKAKLTLWEQMKPEL